MLGIIPTFISDKYKNKIINFSLSFSAGTMITLSFFSQNEIIFAKKEINN